MTDLFQRLQPGPLPLFRRTRKALMELSPRREGLAARDVAHEVLLDPLATLQTLHAINLKVGERFGTEVVTVEHALMMQGLGAFLDGTMALPVLEDSPAGKDALAYAAIQALTRRAQHAAWQARDFAVLHSDVRAEEVQVAALLHVIPEILLWLRAPDLARQLRKARRKQASELAETTVLGQTLSAMTPGLLEAWNLPPLTRELLDDRLLERSRQAIVHACLHIAAKAEKGWWDETLLEDYIALAGVENTPLESIIATVHGNAARVARSVDWLESPPAAAWGPMLPGPWPEEPDDDEAAPAAQPAPNTAPATPAKTAPAAPAVQAPRPQMAPADMPPPVAPRPVAEPEIAVPMASIPEPKPVPAPEPAEDAHTICPMPDKGVFKETLKGIESHLDGSLTLNQLSAIILKGLHTGLGLSRILFAMVTPDGSRVKTRFSLGIPSSDPLRHFEFPTNSRDLFGQLMGKMQGVWVNEGNRAKLWPLVDPKLQKIIGEGDFYAMSLFNGAQPVGLIYADRGHGECGLDPLTYTDFKMLCLQSARGLGKIKRPA